MRRLIGIALTGLFCLAGCGGGGGGSMGPTTPTSPGSGGSATNVAPLVVDTGPKDPVNPSYVPNDLNLLFTTVTICAPGDSGNCQTIDHIQVDTASTGLRIMSSVLSPSLKLPQQTDATGTPLAECFQFVDSYSWGSVRSADIHIGGETASGMPIEVIGDSAYPTVPNACQTSSTGSAQDTVSAFGANGILGVSSFIADCGPACTTTANSIYYGCPSEATCASTAVAQSRQVSNPVAFFATDNNGVIVQLPTVPSGGAATVSGSLIFGIGTQSNNGLGGATVFTANPTNGNISTVYKNTTYPDSFFDTGSNAFYFSDSSITSCSKSTSGASYLCPSSTLSLSAVVYGQDSAGNASGTSNTVGFSIANATTLFNDGVGFAAFNDVGATNSTLGTSFDWGLPFFYGHTVFTAIETKNTPGGVGPYIAF